MIPWLLISPTEIIPTLLAVIVSGYALFTYYLLRRRKAEERELEELHKEQLRILNKYGNRDTSVKGHIRPGSFESGFKIEDEQKKRYQIEVTPEEYYTLQNLLKKIESADFDNRDSDDE